MESSYNEDTGARQTREISPVKQRSQTKSQKVDLEQVYRKQTHQNQYSDYNLVHSMHTERDLLFADHSNCLDNYRQTQKESEHLGVLPLLASMDREDERPKKAAHKFGKILSKCSLIRTKNKKPRKRVLSLSNITLREKITKQLQSVQTDSKFPEEGPAAEKGAQKARDLLMTGSRSLQVCCGMTTGYGDQGDDTDQWSLNADISSVDGSCFSDSSADEPEPDPEDHLFKSGAGSTDTDTDDTEGSARKQESRMKNVQGEFINETVGQIPPLLIYYCQATREFKWERFYFNHYENIDFSVFEFGNRSFYFMWRCTCLLVIILLLFLIYLTYGIRGLHPFPDTDIDLCLHLWLTWILLLQLTIEVVVLAVQFLLYPTCYLARFHTTPIYWKAVWYLNNIVAANILSLVFMNTFIFRTSDIRNFSVGAKAHLILTFMSLIQTSIGAIPVRAAHGVHPMVLTLTFILYVNIYRPCSSFPQRKLTTLSDVEDRSGKAEDDLSTHYGFLKIDLCYLEPLIWQVHRPCSAIFTCMWVITTFICHCALVLVCWFRRVVFRYRRKKSAPVYGQSPRTHFFAQFGAEVSPNMLRMVEEDGFKPSKFVTGVDNSPPFTPAVRKRQRHKKQQSFLEAELDALDI